MRRISVGDIMTREVVSASPSSTLHECAKKMSKENVNSLPIVSESRLVGILTSGDILRVLTKNPSTDLRKIKAIKIATKKLAVISPAADISQAIQKMRSLNYRRLPVMSQGELLGVVTLKDILSVEPNLYSETNHLIDEIKEFDRKTKETNSDWNLQGLCDNCGAFSDLLKVEDQLLCQDCREELN